MNTFTFDQLASISDLQRNYVSLIQKVKKLAKPLVLLRRNEPEAILVSIPQYEELINKRILFEEKESLEMIKGFKKDQKADKLLIANTPDDLFK